MFLVDVNKWSNDPEGLTAELTGLLEKQGAEVLVARPWDERRLAYPIRGQRKAVYWMSYFRVEGSKIDEIERQSRLREVVLRHLILRVNEKLVDPLLAQLQGSPSSKQDEPKDEPSKQDKPKDEPSKQDKPKDEPTPETSEADPIVEEAVAAEPEEE